MHATLNSDPAPFADVRVLIFDLDGTLIDSGADLALSVNATLKELGRAPLPNDRIFGYVGQGAARLIEQALGPGATREECEQGLAFFLSYYRAHMLDNTVTYPGVREGLAALDGMPMAVLTNKPVRFSRQILEGLGLASYFRYIYGGNSFETQKTQSCGNGRFAARFWRRAQASHARGRFRSGRADGAQCRHLVLLRDLRPRQPTNSQRIRPISLSTVLRNSQRTSIIRLHSRAAADFVP